MSSSKLGLCAMALVAISCATTQAGVNLIDATTNNGSFELLGGAPSAAKATHWDTDSDGDVDNWTLWDATTGGPAVNLNDSGTDASGAATDGTHVAFLQEENGAYNLTSYVVQVGDAFSYSWDWVLDGRGAADAGLAYLDGGNIVAIAGTESSAPGGTPPVLGITGSYIAQAGDPAIGKQIALTVSTPSGSNYPEVDNFVLTLVPEPTSITLGGMVLLGLLMGGRFKKRV